MATKLIKEGVMLSQVIVMRMMTTEVSWMIKMRTTSMTQIKKIMTKMMMFRMMKVIMKMRKISINRLSI